MAVGVGFNDSTTWQHLACLVHWSTALDVLLVRYLDLTDSIATWQQQQIGKLELLDLTLVVLEINDSMKAQEQLLGFNVLTLDAAAKSTAWLETLANRFNAGINTVMMDGTSQLKPGLYILEVIVNSKERMMVKLVKE